MIGYPSGQSVRSLKRTRSSMNIAADMASESDVMEKNWALKERNSLLLIPNRTREQEIRLRSLSELLDMIESGMML